jgi:hypothetical protein
MPKARRAFKQIAEATKRITPSFIRRIHRRPPVIRDLRNNRFYQMYRSKVNEMRKAEASHI